MSIEIINEIPDNLWAEFVYKKRGGNIFHTKEMFSVFLQTKNYQPQLWVAVKNGRILALFMPVFMSLFPSAVFNRLTTRAVSFGSVLDEEGIDGNTAISVLISAYSRQARERALFTEMRNLCDIYHLKSLMKELGFYYENHLNYLIRLDNNPESVFRRIGARTKKNIKRTIKRGLVQIEEINELDKIDECYSLLLATYKRAALPLADISLFKAAYKILLPKGMLKITLARVDGQPAAVSFDLLFKNIMYGWYGGVDRRYKRFLPNELLTWKLLEWGCLNGYKIYDFGGAGRPGQKYGVRDFKAKFGGEEVNYGRFKNIHSKLLYYPIVVLYDLIRPILFRKF
ncbi:MAG: GNAT family N-acetyltransferase [Tepidanaerobacteraceae bacterium]|jgi:lipid II:glycine glycyltransferase (peptidoglycan interpeptide bridge formation enzyme)|nr:GNAT family N-acetyltransferase [Tepidanaerobacteraceae bacterium]